MLISDLSTRRGLRDVHKRFEHVYSRLQTTYAAAAANQCPQYMAGIVGIMVKMSKDFVLRDKLFERGKHRVLPLALRSN